MQKEPLISRSSAPQTIPPQKSKELTPTQKKVAAAFEEKHKQSSGFRGIIIGRLLSFATNPEEKIYKELRQELIQLSGEDETLVNLIEQGAGKIHSILYEDKEGTQGKGLQNFLSITLMRGILLTLEKTGKKDSKSTQQIIDCLIHELLSLLHTHFSKVQDIEQKIHKLTQKIQEMEEGESKETLKTDLEKERSNMKMAFKEFTKVLLLHFFPEEENSKNISKTTRVIIKVAGWFKKELSWDGITGQIADKFYEVYEIYKNADKEAKHFNESFEGGGKTIQNIFEKQLSLVRKKGLYLDVISQNERFGRLSPEAQNTVTYLFKIFANNPGNDEEIEKAWEFIASFGTIIVNSYLSAITPKTEMRKTVFAEIGAFFDASPVDLSEKYPPALLQIFIPFDWLYSKIPPFVDNKNLTKPVAFLLDKGSSLFRNALSFLGKIKEGSSQLETRFPKDGREFVDQWGSWVWEQFQKNGMKFLKDNLPEGIEPQLKEKIICEAEKLLTNPNNEENIEIIQKRIKELIINTISTLLFQALKSSKETSIYEALAEFIENQIHTAEQMELKSSEDFENLAKKLLEQLFTKEMRDEILPKFLNLDKLFAKGLGNWLKEVYNTKNLLMQRPELSPKEKEFIAKVRPKMRKLINTNIDEIPSILGKTAKKLLSYLPIQDRLNNFIKDLLPGLLHRIVKGLPSIKEEQFIGKATVRILSVINSRLQGRPTELKDENGKVININDQSEFYDSLKAKLLSIQKNLVPMSDGLTPIAERQINAFLDVSIEQLKEFEKLEARISLILSNLQEINDSINLEDKKLLGPKPPASVSKKIESSKEHVKRFMKDLIHKNIKYALNRKLDEKGLNKPLAFIFRGIVKAAHLPLKFVVNQLTTKAVDILFRDDFEVLMREVIWESLTSLEKTPEVSSSIPLEKQIQNQISDFLKITDLLPKKIANPISKVLTHKIKPYTHHSIFDVANKLLVDKKKRRKDEKVGLPMAA